MRNQTGSKLDQTHLGWQTLPTGGHQDQDKLVFSDPPQPTVTTEDQQEASPTFLNQDATFEGPALLWGSSDSDVDDNLVSSTKEESVPLVVFTERSANQTQPADSATIFS